MDDSLFALAERAVDTAAAAGATHAEARVVWRRHRAIDARNGHVEAIDAEDALGIGVRVMHGSGWGFAATTDLDEASVDAVTRRAVDTARASARVAGARPLQLADVPVARDHWETAIDEDPFAMPVTEPVDLVTSVTQTMHDAGVAQATAMLRFWDTRQWFVSSEGHRISQRIVESGGGMAAMAVGDSETQVRSYPQSFGHYLAGGFEVVREFDLPAHAGRLANEAQALLTADPCPSGTMDLVLGSSQVALQIHESVGHATELDRILGWEAAFAGTSFLDLAELGRLRYGSPLMNITADATLPRAMGSFGYDDEGTPAQCVDIVRDGTWVGVLSGRDSAHEAGVPAGGMVRGDGFARLPMVRMTNVGLEPGHSSLEEMIAGTERGLYMDTNRSWSIDDRRLNFQFGCEVGWEIVDGKLGRMVRNPTYTGITPRFWGSLDGLGGSDEWTPWGLPNCGKGQPIQTAHTGHPAVPARFRDVRVGVTG